MLRIDGIAVAVIALLYGWGILGIEESQVGIQDRVGPGFFPSGIALFLLACGIVMMLRKDGVDHRKVWPSRNFWKAFFVLVVILITYALTFDYLGFFVANTLLCTYMGVLLKSRLIPSLIAGVGIAFCVFLVFNVLLEINLPYGILSFLEEWILG